MTIDSSTFSACATELLYSETDCIVRLLGGLGWMCGAAWWSSPLRDMIRALLPSNDAILGWLTSQLTRQCFISFFRINVCLSTASKATSQGSLTTSSFIWFIYKPCPCVSLSFSTHLAVHGWSHWSSQTSANNVCPQPQQQHALNTSNPIFIFKCSHTKKVNHIPVNVMLR